MHADSRHRLDDYTAEEIQVFQPITDHVRTHPGMYIGNTQERGLHELLFQLVRTSLAETRAGFGCTIWVTMNRDGSLTFSDDGRGFAVSGPPHLEVAFTQLCQRRRWWIDQCWYAVVNALSEWLWVETRREGESYELYFEQGVATGAPHAIGSSPNSGITLMFLPDPVLFGETRFDPDTIRDRLREYACLNSGVRLSFRHSETGVEDIFEFADGIPSYVRWVNVKEHPWHPDVTSPTKVYSAVTCLTLWIYVI